MTNLREKIEEILIEYRDRVTSMGEFFDNKPTIQAAEQILQVIEEVLPKESIPLAGSLEDKYGYLAGKRKGFNSCLAQIRERIGESGN